MKALVLAGGTGSRLRPLTYTSAKQLIPIANRPILFYAIEAIRDAGITDIGVIVGETRAEVMAALGSGERWGVEFTFIEQDAPRGLAHAVMIAEEFIGGNSFLMFLGDNLIRSGVTRFVRTFMETGPNSLILLSRVPDPQRFGVAELRDGKVIRLVEKPKVPPSDLALVGVYLFDHHVFQAVREIKPSWRNELEITDAIQWLVEHGYRVDPYTVEGWWKDTGKPEDVLDANRLILETIEPLIAGEVSGDSQIIGRVIIEPGARVVNSVIRGPAVIGSQALIQDSYVGPFTAVSPQVTIQNAEIENSIVLDGSSIIRIPHRIDGSLIGRNAVVTHTGVKPKAVNMVLGDNSRVSIP